MTDRDFSTNSDISADVDLDENQKTATGYFKAGFEHFTTIIKDYRRIALVVGVTGGAAALAVPIIRAIRERHLIAA